MKTYNYFISAKIGQITKFSKRLNKLLETGKFHSLTRQKQNMLLGRLKRLYLQIRGFVPEAKLQHLLAPAVALMLGFQIQKANAQSFAPAQTNPFGLIAVSDYAFPAFADIDADGDLDAFFGELSGNIIYFENSGTSVAPSFGAPQTNPFGITGNGDVSLPVLVDIDGDGDFDLFVGDNYGDIFYFENTGTTSAPSFGPVQTSPFGIVQGGFSAPAFADLDDDSDYDLIVGEYSGDFLYYENTGTSTAPAFAAPQTNSLGLTSTGGYIALPAFGDIDGDGDMDILAGGNGDNLLFYENTGSPTTPSFAAPATNPFGLGSGNVFAIPTCTDIDGDGDLDVFAGEYYGNVKFYENVSIPDDLGVTQLLSPVTNCNLGSSETVEVEVRNFGTNAQNSFSVSYSFGGNAPITENVVSVVLNPGGTYIHTFGAAVNMENIGSYDLEAWTTLAGDTNNFNDTLGLILNHKPVIDTFPFVEDFESGSNGWTTGGENSSWELGAPAGSLINSAASGTNAWVTSLSAFYNNMEQSYVEGPCFDLTNLTNALVELNISHDIEQNWDGSALYSSTDGGSSWQIIGAFGDTVNWYNNTTIEGLQLYMGNGDGWDSLSGGWITARHDIGYLDGESQVLFRIIFGSDGSVTEEGMGFDDFKITGDFSSPNPNPDPSTGIETGTIYSEPRMYPNPAKSLVSIEIDPIQADTRIELWNLTGQLVRKEIIAAGGNLAMLGLNNFTTGIYLVKIIQHDQSFTKKLVIQ